jgi:hypothetical protein
MEGGSPFIVGFARQVRVVNAFVTATTVCSRTRQSQTPSGQDSGLENNIMPTLLVMMVSNSERQRVVRALSPIVMALEAREGSVNGYSGYRPSGGGFNMLKCAPQSSNNVLCPVLCPFFIIFVER